MRTPSFSQTASFAPTCPLTTNIHEPCRGTDTSKKPFSSVCPTTNIFLAKSEITWSICTDSVSLQCHRKLAKNRNSDREVMPGR
jgi:hypothetical protein